MKKTYHILLLIFSMVLITSSGCKKIIDEDINTDPNKPADVPMSLLLPSAEGALAFSFGSDLGRFPSLFVQSYSGISNQHLLFDNYSLTESDVNNMWFYNLYGGALENLKLLMDKAVAQNSPHYGGIAKILMANALGVTTDLWGDIPYSQAFQGVNELSPAFDSQEQIYETIQSLLSSAISDLSGSSTLTPSGDDIIYGGDVALWTEAANALKARYYLHLSKVPGSDAYNKALTALTAGSFQGNSENMMFYFGEDPTAANPIYQFFTDGRPGDAAMGQVMIDQLNNTNDPRAAQIAADADATDTIITYVGSPAGAGDGSASNVGPFYNTNTSPVAFVTYPEIKFIEAECEFQNGNLANAATAFNTGVAASLDYFGVSDPAFIAAVGSETAGTITMDKIITQKYVHLFSMGYEQWTDWRRTGIPALTLAVQAQTSEVPRRLPYPNSERLYNTANYNTAIAAQGGASLVDRVWWDK